MNPREMNEFTELPEWMKEKISLNLESLSDLNHSTIKLKSEFDMQTHRFLAQKKALTALEMASMEADCEFSAMYNTDLPQVESLNIEEDRQTIIYLEDEIKKQRRQAEEEMNSVSSQFNAQSEQTDAENVRKTTSLLEIFKMNLEKDKGILQEKLAAAKPSMSSEYDDEIAALDEITHVLVQNMQKRSAAANVTLNKELKIFNELSKCIQTNDDD